MTRDVKFKIAGHDKSFKKYPLTVSGKDLTQLACYLSTERICESYFLYVFSFFHAKLDSIIGNIFVYKIFLCRYLKFIIITIIIIIIIICCTII